MKYTISPVAFVKNSRTETTDDFWGNTISEIHLAEEFTEDAVKGIEGFSHLEIIFLFDKVKEGSEEKSSSRPRGNNNWPETGIFAQRKKKRPNRLGASIVTLLKKEGKVLTVKYLDAIDGTPVMDIKPVIKEFIPSCQISQPAWADELMKDYWK